MQINTSETWIRMCACYSYADDHMLMLLSFWRLLGEEEFLLGWRPSSTTISLKGSTAFETSKECQQISSTKKAASTCSRKECHQRPVTQSDNLLRETRSQRMSNYFTMDGDITPIYSKHCPFTRRELSSCE